MAPSKGGRPAKPTPALKKGLQGGDAGARPAQYYGPAGLGLLPPSETVGIALSGGSLHGDFETGALSLLYDRGISPGVVVGTSVGALNGAKLAEGPDAINELGSIWRGLNSIDDVYQQSAWVPTAQSLLGDPKSAFHTLEAQAIGNWFKTLFEGGVGDPDILDNLLAQVQAAPGLYNFSPLYTKATASNPAAGLISDPRNFDPAKVGNSGIALRICVTCLDSGEVRFVTESGAFLDGSEPAVDLRDAIIASASVPVIDVPITLNGRFYVDGGVREVISVQAAFNEGADRVYAITGEVDAMDGDYFERPFPSRHSDIKSIEDVLVAKIGLRAATGIMTNAILRNETDPPRGWATGLADGRPAWTGDFDGDKRTEIMSYNPADDRWWLGVFDPTGKLNWKLVGSNLELGHAFTKRVKPFWIGDFDGDGRDEIMTYDRQSGAWYLGSLEAVSRLIWQKAGDTSNAANELVPGADAPGLWTPDVFDGRPFWTVDFNGDGRDDLLFYYVNADAWYLGTLDGEKQLTWTLLGTTAGGPLLNAALDYLGANKTYPQGTPFPFVYTQRETVPALAQPVWVGDFNGDGRAEVLLDVRTPESTDGTFWFGSVDPKSQGPPTLGWVSVGDGSQLGDHSRDLDDGSPSWVGSFLTPDRQELLVHSRGPSKAWLLAVVDSNGSDWFFLGDTTHLFAEDGLDFWVGDFNGDGLSDVLHYDSVVGRWYLGIIAEQAAKSLHPGPVQGVLKRGGPSPYKLEWKQIGDTTGRALGNNEGPRFWVGRFDQSSKDQLLWSNVADDDWQLGVIDSTSQLKWTSVGSTPQFGHGAVTVIQPTFQVHGFMDVNPGQISIAIDYGYMRASEIVDWRRSDPSRFWVLAYLSDYISALRTQCWSLEEVLSPLGQPNPSVIPPTIEGIRKLKRHVAMVVRCRLILGGAVPRNASFPDFESWWKDFERHNAQWKPVVNSPWDAYSSGPYWVSAALPP